MVTRRKTDLKNNVDSQKKIEARITETEDSRKEKYK